MSNPMPRRLYRSRTDRMVSGVSGGLAEYFDIDPALVRLLWVLAAIFSGGLAVLGYIVLWIVVPQQGYTGPQSDVMRHNVDEMAAEARRMAEEVRRTVRREPGAAPAEEAPSPEVEVEDILDVNYPVPDTSLEQRRHRRRSWAGIVLIILGALFLVSNLGWLWWLNWRLAWPAVLIAVGLLLLWNRTRE